MKNKYTVWYAIKLLLFIAPFLIPSMLIGWIYECVMRGIKSGRKYADKFVNK